MYCFNDIETTALRPWKAEILTAYYIICDDNLEIVDEREFRFRPVEKHQWSTEAADVHNISWDDAQLFTDKGSATRDLVSWLKSFRCSFNYICHAMPFASRLDLFDYQHSLAHFWSQDFRSEFYTLFPEQKVDSTIIKSRKEALNAWGVRSQKLDCWAEKLGFELRHHRADSDTHGCRHVFKYQQEVAMRQL